MIALCVQLVIAISKFVDSHEYHQPFDNRVDQLKTKWGVETVIRDLDHIKEDVRAMIELKDLGKLTRNEMLFYMIKMHDFDNNGGLDGIEFRAALTHSLAHITDIQNKEEEMENTIEELLKVDVNEDGFVNYGELRKHLDASEKEQPQKTEM